MKEYEVHLTFAEHHIERLQDHWSSGSNRHYRSMAFGQGPVVQSIVSLTTSLRCQFVKYMPTSLSNPLLFFVFSNKT